MSTYSVIVRVELHKDDARKQPHSPNASEYETLHAEMWTRGFRRFYETAESEMLKLPPGEYLRETAADTAKDARDIAYRKSKEAATLATSASRFSLLVNSHGSITSYHLEVISKDPDA